MLLKKIVIALVALFEFIGFPLQYFFTQLSFYRNIGYRPYLSQQLLFIGYRNTAFRYRFIGYHDKVFRYRAHHWQCSRVL